MNPFDLDAEEDEFTVLPAEPAAIVPTEAVKPLSAREERMERLRQVEDEILAESSMVVRDALRFRDIPEDAVAPPEEWVSEIGEEEAWRRFRAAKAGMMSAKTAPVALSLAKATMVGITKARAAQGAARQINIGVSVTMPSPGFTVMDVEGE